jgi:tetratricopeptide (TPR) repeat protein
MGNMYSDIEDFEKAIECYEQAIKIDQQFRQAWTELANVYNELGLYQKAIRIQEKWNKIASNKLLEDDPLKILNHRFARGEITEEEFLRMKKLLEPK